VVKASDFFQDLFTVNLAQDEINSGRPCWRGIPAGDDPVSTRQALEAASLRG
jgi:hypothetical protein